MIDAKSKKIQKRIRIQIPQNLHQQPILSNLVSHYGLELNISAALLDTQATGGGWFDLRLQGTQEQVDNGLSYLSGLKVQMWHEGSEADY